MPSETGTAVVDLSETLSLAELGSDELEDGPAETEEAEGVGVVTTIGRRNPKIAPVFIPPLPFRQLFSEKRNGWKELIEELRRLRGASLSSRWSSQT